MTLNPLDLSGRRILVTGGSSGIGREAAVLFSRLGASVVLLARNGERLDQALRELEGGGHAAVVCDLADCDAIPDAMGAIADEHGPLWGLFHAAGAINVIPVNVVKESNIAQVLDSGLKAALLLARGFCSSKVRAEGGGSIVYMSSVAARAGQPGLSIYSAGKAAVDGAVRSLAVELARWSVRVNSIQAGLVRTGMYDTLAGVMNEETMRACESRYLLGLGTAQDVAHAAAFLLSDAARWITGTTMVVDGGCSCH